MWDPVPDYNALDPEKRSVGMEMFALSYIASKPYLADMTSWTISFSSESEEAIIQTDVKERMLTDWCRCIMAATDEECDALYDEMVADLHDLGLDQLVAAQAETFTVNQEKLNGTYWNK